MRTASVAKILLSLLMLINCAFAAEQAILRIDGDKKVAPSRDFTKVYVATNESGDIKKLTIKSFNLNGHEQNKHEFEATESNLENGLVLKQEDKYEVVVLSSDNFSSIAGGTLKIDYLVSAVSDKRSNLELELVRNDQDDWEVISSKGNLVAKLYLEANTIFGKLVGIDKISIK